MIGRVDRGAWFSAVLAFSLQVGCATDGAGSETHLVCSSDPDCVRQSGIGARCVNGACVAPAAANGDAATSAESGSGGDGAIGGATTLATGGIDPIGIAVDAENVYWADRYGGATTIMQLPMSGGTPVVLASVDSPDWLSGETVIAADGTSVYYLSGCTDDIMKVPAGGGTPVKLAEARACPGNPCCDYAKTYFAVDGPNLYWEYRDYSTSAHEIRKMPSTGGTPETLVSNAGGPIAVDGTSVYWTSSDDGSVWRVPVGGGAPVEIVTAPLAGQGVAIALDATSVYWVHGGSGGAVFKAPLSGGAAVTLASDQASPIGIALDGAHVYWANNPDCVDPCVGPWGLMRVPIAGGTTETLGTGRAPVGVAVGGGNLYWGNAEVRKLIFGGGGAVPPVLSPGAIMKAPTVR